LSITTNRNRLYTPLKQYVEKTKQNKKKREKDGTHGLEEPFSHGIPFVKKEHKKRNETFQLENVELRVMLQAFYLFIVF
jgi:hypothetical protein